MSSTKHITQGGQVFSYMLGMFMQVNKRIANWLILATLLILPLIFYLKVPTQEIRNGGLYWWLKLTAGGEKALYRVPPLYDVHFDDTVYHFTSAHILKDPYMVYAGDIVLQELWLSVVWTTVWVGVLALVIYGTLYRLGKRQANDDLVGGRALTEDVKAVAKQMRRQREASSITFDGLPLLLNSEVKNIVMHGTPGSGKSNAINKLLIQLRERGDTHGLVINATALGEQWRTLSSDTQHKQGFSEAIYALQVSLGQIYRHTLRQEIESLGFKTHITGKNGLWEMDGVPVAPFSQRRQHIVEAVGHEASLKSRDVAALDTRQVKHTPDKSTLLTDWFARLDKNGFGVDERRDFYAAAEQRAKQKTVQATASVQPDIREAVTAAIALLSDKQLSMTYSQVLSKTLNGLTAEPGLIGHVREAIDHAIDTHQLIPLDEKKGLFTSAIHLKGWCLSAGMAISAASSVIPLTASRRKPAH